MYIYMCIYAGSEYGACQTIANTPVQSNIYISIYTHAYTYTYICVYMQILNMVHAKQ